MSLTVSKEQLPSKPAEEPKRHEPQIEEPAPRVEKVDGRSPIERDSNKWADIDRTFRKYYGEPLTITQEADKRKENVEDRTDAQVRELLAQQYSYFHCDSLLAEGKVLLENALPLREQWRELGAEEFNLKQEIDEFRELDRIHQLEVADGFYELMYDRINYQKDGESALHDNNSLSEQALRQARLGALSDSYLRKYEASIDATAWASHVPSHEETRNAYDYSITVAGETISGKKWDLTNKLSWPMSVVARVLIDVNSYIQLKSAQAAAESSAARRTGLHQELIWASKDIKHRKDRTKASRDLMDLKMLEAIRPGGALNFKERRDAIKVRFLRDFEVAVALTGAANTGLEKLYGIRLPRPSPGDASYFDKLLNWVTDCLHRLNAFQRKEQSYAKVIVAASGGVPENFRMKVEEKEFKGLSHVRVRGVSAHTLGETKGSWEIRLTPPQFSYIRHADGKTEEVGFSKPPNVILGRVRQRDFSREPDVGGMSALKDSSPFGEWTVGVEEKSTAGESRDKLTGLEIDLHLVFVPLQGQA